MIPGRYVRTDIGLIHRIYRESAWFSCVVALCAAWRGYDWPVWAGLLAGAATALAVLLSFEVAVVAATSERRRIAPGCLGALGVLEAPLLALVVWLSLSVAGLSGAAFAVGVTIPVLVGVLKAVGRAWSEWAAAPREPGGRP